MAETPLIRDLPKFQKAIQDVKALKSIKAVMPVLRPFLKLLGVDTNQMDKALAQTEELERMAEELASLPDRFNDLFAHQGWIIYDLMNAEVVKAAIKKAESGDIDGAETDLVNYYSAETVRWKLQTMMGLEAFRPRMSLAQKALVDYSEGRYHACIPVILALLDGLVTELHDKRRGFFAEEASLEAWDSIAAHSKGLNTLASIFRKGRRKTVVETITVPYRHGILHGMDLGYDNRIVAAKTWAALFAARDWALKAEQGLLAAPPPQSSRTWSDIAQQFRDNKDTKERLSEWKPRSIRPGLDLPNTGEPSLFDEDTPERKLAEYLLYWKARNFGQMAGCLSALIGYDAKVAPARVREVYAARSLKSFEFTEINDVAPAITVIEVRLLYEENKQQLEKSVQFRLMCEDAEGQTVVRGKPGSKWAIIVWGFA